MVTIAIAALGLLGAGAADASAPAPADRAAADRHTPVVMSVMSPPSWFKGTDGCLHLVHELQLTNGIGLPVTVTSVSVQDVDRGRTLEELDGARLTESMSLMAVAAAPTTTIPGSAVGVIWFDITFRDREGIPDRISHTLTVAVPPGLPVPTSVTDSGAEAAVDTRPPVELGPPLPGPGWIVAGNCRDGAHRRSIQPVNGRLRLGRRFAVDWSGSDARHRPVVGDPDVNRNWVCYGAPVIAVADGTVAAAEDRFPDQIPNHPVPVTPAEADGNFVVLDLGDGRFAGFAHLVPGSVRVRPGDRVRRGQVIGNLGNSGSSSGPHLHFQVMDGPSLVDANGLPFVIDAFRVVGRIPPLDEALTASIDAGNPVPVGPVGRGPRHGELPLGRDVVDFRGPEDRHA